MELVYLWVEEYKNIKQQGFNFSPRFNCKFHDEYDEDGKLKNDCKLEITDNPDFVDIFPPNINITAIVGENGSGKSSVLEALSGLLSYDFSPDQYFTDRPNRTYLLVYKLADSYHYLARNLYTTIQIVDEFQKPIQWITQNPNYGYLLSCHLGLVALILDNQLKYNSQTSIYKRIYVENTQRDTMRIKKIIVQNLLDYQDVLFKQNTNLFFIPRKISIRINKYNLFQKDRAYYSAEIWSKITVLQKSIEQDMGEHNYQSCFEHIIEVIKWKSKDYIQNPLEAFEDLDTTGEKDNIYFQQTYNLNTTANEYSVEDINTGFLETLPAKTLRKNILYEWDITELNNTVIDFIFSLPEIAFDIQLSDNDKIFENLSYGETQLLIQLNFMLYYSKKKVYPDMVVHQDDEYGEIETEEDFPINDMLILLDEFELGMHPNWQKKSLNYLTDFLKLFDKKFHIILTSHSPFLLSDLPKENIIFLKNGKAVDGVSMKQTFGANIHTLLSDGFFMSDGLMGEFAKGKIDNVIKLLNQNKLSKDEIKHCEQIISIIGEPIIKNQLQRMLDSKRLKKVDKIDKIEQEIRRLKQSLKELQDDKKPDIQ